MSIALGTDFRQTKVGKSAVEQHFDCPSPVAKPPTVCTHPIAHRRWCMWREAQVHHPANMADDRSKRPDLLLAPTLWPSSAGSQFSACIWLKGE